VPWVCEIKTLLHLLNQRFLKDENLNLLHIYRLLYIYLLYIYIDFYFTFSLHIYCFKNILAQTVIIYITVHDCDYYDLQIAKSAKTDFEQNMLSLLSLADGRKTTNFTQSL